MNQGDTFAALHALAQRIIEKHTVDTTANHTIDQGDTFDALDALAQRIIEKHTVDTTANHTIDLTVDLSEYALITLGTCDHVDIWGETGVDGIACKSPAIKQCEGCGESMCKGHIAEVAIIHSLNKDEWIRCSVCDGRAFESCLFCGTCLDCCSQAESAALCRECAGKL